MQSTGNVYDLNNRETNTSHWVVAVGIAVLVHSFLFISYHRPSGRQGALHEGQYGIEIGLKKLVPPPGRPKPVESKPVVKEQPKPEPKPAPMAASFEEPQINEEQEMTDGGESTAGGGDPNVEISYASRLLAWLERYKAYPVAARRRGQQDTVLLQFVINADGELISFSLVRPSDFEILNRAVEKMIQRADPLPPVPEVLRNGKIEFIYVVPVEFVLNG